jgi:glycosyltransferase involved in cell wall biosynthesis
VSRKPHILLLGMQFPPARGSGVYRIRSWANHFARRGCDVTVLAADSAYFAERSGAVDPELEKTVDPRVRVVRITVPREHLRHDVRTMSWAHANFPRAWIRSHEWARKQIFPEVYASILPLFVARGAAVHARHRVDVVFATGNPYTQYGAAYRLGRLLRRPYVVDYHDPWTMNPLTEADAFPPDHPAFVWERRIVEKAALTVTVNDPLGEWYRERYPVAAQRIRVVENGLAEEVVGEVGFTPPDPQRPARVGFVGTIRSDLPIEEYLDGWGLARKEPELRDATMDFYGYLGFFTQNEAGIRSRIESVEAGVDGVAYRGPVPQTEVGRVYSGLDVLAMILPSSRYMTAGKGYDYMAAGRPVIGVHEPRNHTTQVFRDYPLFFGTPTVTAEAVRDALVASVRAARAQTREQYDACRAIALAHTWDKAMDPVGAEVERLAHG